MDELRIPSLSGSPSLSSTSERSDLPLLPVRAADHYRTPTPPSSPLGHLDDHDKASRPLPPKDRCPSTCEVEVEVEFEVDRAEHVPAIVASLARVLDQLQVIQSVYFAGRPTRVDGIPVSYRHLALLHELCNDGPPLERRVLFTPAERAALQQLRLTRRRQLRSLAPWFSRCRSDFYHNTLFIRMPSILHFEVTNHIAMYLYHRFTNKLAEAGHPEYVGMLRHGGKRLVFARSRHEPDAGVWLDFEHGFLGDDSEQEKRVHAVKRKRDDASDEATADMGAAPGARAQTVGQVEEPDQAVPVEDNAATATTDNGTTERPTDARVVPLPNAPSAPSPDPLPEERRPAEARKSPTTDTPAEPGTNPALDGIEVPRETSLWPAIVVEVGWSNPTPDKVCVDYLKEGGGDIRCVLRINIDYIHPKNEDQFEKPTRAVLDGWRLGPSEPVRFIDKVDIFTSDTKVAITLHDLHESLPPKPVPLSLMRLATFVQTAFRSQKRVRDQGPEAGDEHEEEPYSNERRRSKRARF